jgi:YHS domain-containing protein
MMKRLAIAFAFAVAGGCAKSSTPEAAKPAPPAAAAPAAAAATGDPAPLAVGAKTRCPVTGEDFTVGAKTVQVVHDGKRYAFCCADCQPEFAKNPAKYVKN